MWIKNDRGDLVNTDYLESIDFHKDLTRGWYNGDWSVLAKGDVRDRIGEAIRRGYNFMEVINDGR